MIFCEWMQPKKGELARSLSINQKIRIINQKLQNYEQKD